MKKALALVLILCLGIFAGCNIDKPVETDPLATNPPATSGDSGDTTPTTDAPEAEYSFPAGAEIHVICGHDIDNAAWNAMIADLAQYGDADIIATYDAAYARYLEGEVA